MEINADFSQPVLVHSDVLDWVPSPMVGVDRRMLDRIGAEVARATSIVRYAKGSAFAQHTHSGGEEFIVLDGVIQDEHGDYPTGTYVRNPVGTHHVPSSEPGCTIFVKLWQFEPDDQEQLAIDLNSLELIPDPDNPSRQSAVLARRNYEEVILEQWAPETEMGLCDPGGVEVLVLAGSLMHGGEVFSPNDWMRWPSGQKINLRSGSNGARLWIKHGHLRDIRLPPQS